MSNANNTSQHYVAIGLVESKRPGIVAVKKHVAKELCRDPYWRKKLDNASSTAEAIKIIREFGEAKGYSTDEDET